MKKLNRIISIILIIIMISSVLPKNRISLNAQADTYEELWDDVNQAYIISTVEDLKLFRESIYNQVDYSGKTVYLLNDIKLEEGDDVGSIGTVADNSETSIFQGTFNGRGHCIEGWNKSDEALFLTVGENGSITNLDMKNVNIENASPGCVYAFQNSGAIAKCSASGTIVGDANNYGSFTYANSGTITDCISSCNISTTKSTTKIAGISYTNSGNISNCIYYGTLTTTQTKRISLYGISSKNVTNSYYLYNEQYTAKNGIACTEEELKLQDTYQEFDFDNTWAINKEVNDGYPYLRADFPDLSFVKRVPVTIEVSVGDYIYNEESTLSSCYFPLTASIVYAGDEEEIQENFTALISTYQVSVNLRTSNWKSDFLVDAPVNGVSQDFSSKRPEDYFNFSYAQNEEYEFYVSGYTLADSVGTYYDDSTRNNCLTSEQKNQVIQKADATVRTILNSIYGIYGADCMQNPFFDFTCARAGYYPSGTSKDQMFYSLSSMWKEYKDYQTSAGKSPETTETSKFVLAITALGFDPTDVAGDNLITELYNSDANGKYFAAHYKTYALYCGGYGDYVSEAASLVKTVISSSKETSYNADDMETMYAQPIFLLYGRNTAASGIDTLTLNTYVENQIKPWMQRSITGFGNFYSTYTHCSANVWTDAQAQILIGLLNIDFLSEPYVKNGHTILDYIIAHPDLSLGYSGDESQCARAIVALTRSYRGQNNLFDCSDVTGVREVESMISALPEEITEDDTQAVTDVEMVFNSLTSGQQNQVDNSSLLQKALATLEQIEVDKELAKEMIEMIDSIGEVTLESGDTITSVRNAYNNLTEAQKKRISNYQTLVDAENTLTKLKAEEAKRIAEEEKKKKENSASKNNTTNKSTSDKPNQDTTQKSSTNQNNSESNTKGITSSNAQNKTSNDATNNGDSNTNNINSNYVASLEEGNNQSGVSAGMAEDTSAASKKGARDKMIRHIAKLPIDGDGILNTEKVTEEQVIALYKEYEALSAAEKKKVTNYTYLQQAMECIALRNQTDQATGIVLEEAAWNLKLVVNPIDEMSEEAKKFQKAIGENAVLLLYDIKLVDILTNTTCEPEDSVKLGIPSELISEEGKYSGLVIGHLHSDGKLEYMECTKENGYFVFCTKSFSVYGVLGYQKISPLNLNGEAEESKKEIPNVIWIVTGSIGIAIIIFLLILNKRTVKPLKKDSEEENREGETYEK